ncbi:MAG: hypothetical protein LBS43_11285 [Prevotellaceae bacterium]|jgi:hypothetical protein|nr:hypothetical protein [Prevotellaceae bacterium]
MFYARINKIKVFNNREGFLGLFNRRAELRIYSVATNPFGLSDSGHIVCPVRYPPVRLEDLAHYEEEFRKERLLEAVTGEAERFAQSAMLEINGVKDNIYLLHKPNFI